MTQTTNHNIYYVSMGAPSIYMLLKALRVNTYETIEDYATNFPDEVVYVDLGAEYPEVNETAELIQSCCQAYGIPFTKLSADIQQMCTDGKRASPTTKHTLFNKAFEARGSKGYGWCGGRCRWGTNLLKLKLVNQHLKSIKSDSITCFIGFTVDEAHRKFRPSITTKAYSNRIFYKYPLVDRNTTKAQCVEELKNSNIPTGKLYSIGLTHIGCWCCRNHSIPELLAIKQHLPTVWDKLVQLESDIGEPYYRSPKGLALLNDVANKCTKFTYDDKGNKI